MHQLICTDLKIDPGEGWRGEGATAPACPRGDATELSNVDLILDSQIDQLHKVVRIVSIQYKKLWIFWTNIWQKTLGEQ